MLAKEEPKLELKTFEELKQNYLNELGLEA
jgi:hypothetical protein